MKDTILVWRTVRETLKNVTNLSVQTCITYPPHIMVSETMVEKKSQIGQEDTPEEYIQNLVSVFRSVRDTLKDDGNTMVKT